jgi:ABC-type glycerol-3-phosphate transport system permease component
LPVPHSRRRDGDQGEARAADGGRSFEHLLVAVDGKGQISAVIFYLMAQKHIIAGLTSGAVKS